MAYTKQTWADGEAGGTPIDAASLNHLEDGVASAAGVADAAQAAADGKADASHTHAISDVAGLETALAEKATNEALADLAARVAALETPAG